MKTSPLIEDSPASRPQTGRESTALPSASGRIGEIDALRGLAALAVLFFHLTRRFYEDYGRPSGALPPFPIAGVEGVYLFFIISGFVISQTLERTRRSSDFVVSRFSRIFPTYWTCVILTFLCVTLFGLPGREVSVTDALINLTMLQDHLNVPDVDYVYWSLTIELTFYAIAWIAHVRGWLHHHPYRFACGWLAYGVAWEIARRYVKIPDEVALLTLPTFAPLFVAGMMFHRIHRRTGSWRTHAVIAACLILHNVHHRGGYTGAVLSTGMILCFYLLISGRLTFLRAAPLVFLGALSYPLYLLHNNIGMILLRSGLSARIPYVVSLVGAIAVIIGLSTLVHRAVELPSMKWIRRRWKARPASA